MALAIKERFKDKGTSLNHWALSKGFASPLSHRVAKYGWSQIGEEGTETLRTAKAMSKFLGDKSLEVTFGKRD